MQKVVGKNVFVELSINMCLLLASYCCSANDHKHGDLEQMTTNTAAERAPSFSESFGGMKHETKTLAGLFPLKEPENWAYPCVSNSQGHLTSFAYSPFLCPLLCKAALAIAAAKC